jgi:hypothetical protein
MKTTNTFSYESFNNRMEYFDAHETGLTYRPYQSPAINVKWEEIKYLEHISGERVDIYFNNESPIPIRYETKEFSHLLEMICFKIAGIQKEKFARQKFSATTLFILHISFVLTFCGICLLAGFTTNWVSSFIFAVIFVPLGYFLLRQTISITLYDQYFMERSFISRRAVNYKEIEKVGLDLRTNEYGSNLYIVLSMQLKNNIVIKKLNNIFLLFILLKIKLNENSEGVLN